MKTYDPVRLERTTINQESMARARRTKRAGLVFGIGLTLAAVLGGCASGAGSSGSLAIPSVAIPSINASAAASAGAQIALGVLDRIDAAIAAAQTSGGLSAENATTLKDLSAKIRTPLQTGDLASAKTAFTDFTAKVDQFASGMTGDAGTKLRDVVAQLKAAVGS